MGGHPCVDHAQGPEATGLRILPTDEPRCHSLLSRFKP
jgi:hypothetical protein